ncbi:MAG TPA: MASE1 domain-containing protein [Steroidobacteraceae bacterium]|jgi:signal transduction histidine kinase/CheY-like chemotaxis protein
MGSRWGNRIATAALAELRKPAYLAEILAVALAYYIAGRLGLQLATAQQQVSPVWPDTGLALALLVLRGRRLWPGILLGSFAANLGSGAVWPAAAGISVGDTLEAVVGSTLLLRVGFQPSLRRLHDVASLFLLAACLSTMISATVGTTMLCLTHAAPWSAYSAYWSTWWIGDAVSDLVGAPFIFVWVDQARSERRFGRLTEAVLLLLAMGVLSAAVFVDRGTGVVYPVHYLIFPAVIWAALRLGQHGTSTLVLGSLIVTIVGTLYGRGPFVGPSINASLLQVTLFMSVVAVTGLFLGAATAERNRAERRRSADYARLRSSEERLARQAEELATADRRKDEFLAVLGHELRNPLAPLQNALELLARAGSDPAILNQVRGLMERQMRHLVRLVDDLLDVARIRSGKIVLELERVELSAMISSAVELARPQIDAREHRLEVELPSHEVWIQADRTRLPQLLTNLLNNSAKYSQTGGLISVSCSRDEEQATVRVRDTGIGMTPEALANVFELFAQAAGPQHTVQGGLGVGLSLARSIAELHGGTLTARSEGPGRGSEFLLQLPLSSAPEGSDAHTSAGRIAAGHRILIVDDNIDAADSLGIMLAHTGHEVRVAYGGRQALETADRFTPDTMILDLGMPEMDGYAVARAVRSNPQLRHVRLIALSGYGQEEDRRRTSAAGFDQHLVKPVMFDVLNRALS